MNFAFFGWIRVSRKEQAWPSMFAQRSTERRMFWERRLSLLEASVGGTR